ncbi:MAG: MFS transporter [Steroidobacteraceae bacterium]
MSIRLASAGNVRSPKPACEGDFSRRKLKIAAAILIGQTFATSILPYSALTFVMIPMTREFGWTRTEFSLATTFLFVFGAASLWPIGRLADKVGVRPVILIGTALVGLVTIAMSHQTASLALLFAFYTLLGIFGSTGVAYTKVAAALFTQNRGKALAILGAESTIAAAIIPIMTNWLMLDFGWRTMYLVFGVLILAIVPILYFTIEEPGQIGIDWRPRWARKSARSAAAASAIPAAAPVAPMSPPPLLPRLPRLEGMTLSQALHDWVFWLITAAALFGMVILTGMQAHMIPALLGKGFSQTFAAEMTSVFLLVGIGGSLVGGYMADRFHTAKVGAPFSLIQALGAFLLMVVTARYGGDAMLVVAMALGGFSFAAYRPMGQYFQTRFFGLGSFTEIMSFQYMMTNPISAFSAPLIGVIYGRTHSYHLAFMLMAISPLIAGAVWMVLPKYRYSAHIGEMPAPPRGCGGETAAAPPA